MATDPTNSAPHTPAATVPLMQYQRALQLLTREHPDIWESYDFTNLATGMRAPYRCLPLPKGMTQPVREAMGALLQSYDVTNYHFQSLLDKRTVLAVEETMFNAALRPRLLARDLDAPVLHTRGPQMQLVNTVDAVQQEILRDLIATAPAAHWQGGESSAARCCLLAGKVDFERDGMQFNETEWQQAGNRMLKRLCGQEGLEVEVHGSTVVLSLPTAQLAELRQQLRQAPGTVVSHLVHYRTFKTMGDATQQR